MPLPNLSPPPEINADRGDQWAVRIRHHRPRFRRPFRVAPRLRRRPSLRLRRHHPEEAPIRRARHRAALPGEHPLRRLHHQPRRAVAPSIRFGSRDSSVL